MAEEWYYSKNSERRGPIDSATLETLAENGVLTRSDLIWKEGNGRLEGGWDGAGHLQRTATVAQ